MRLLRRLVPGLLAAVVTLGPLVVSTGSAATAAAPATPTYQKSMEVIGTSAKGRKVQAYFRGDPKAAHQVVLIGQIHGNERAGKLIAEHVVRSMRPKAGTGLWVIATLNPDGAVAGTRQNARRVDLNRNFPTTGWRGTRSSCCWGGFHAGSEPETKAAVAFLQRVRPDYVAVLHQPFGVVAQSGKDKAFERRLATELRLPIDPVSIGGPSTGVAPSLTSWFNAKLGKTGTSVTVELPRTTTSTYRTRVAAPGLLRALRVLG